MSFTSEGVRGAVVHRAATLFLGQSALFVRDAKSGLDIEVALSREDHIALAEQHLKYAREMK